MFFRAVTSTVKKLLTPKLSQRNTLTNYVYSEKVIDPQIFVRAVDVYSEK